MPSSDGCAPPGPAGSRRSCASRTSHLRKPRNRRQGREPAEPRILRRQLAHYLLDEEVAEGDAGEPPLAVADGVEDGGIGVDFPVDLPEQQVGDGTRQPLAQCDLHEDERLVRQRGVEESEAAAVRLQSPAQIFPVEDLVHRLVLDDLLEHERRRAPVDSVQIEESAVEPGAEHVHEVGVHKLELRAPGQRVEKGDAHREDVARAVRSGVHQAQELVAPRLGRRRQGRRRFRGRRGAVAFQGGIQSCGLGAEIAAQELEERVPLLRVEARECIEGAAGERHHRRFALGAKQAAAQRANVLVRSPLGAPAEKPLPRRGEAPDDLLPECSSESHGESSPSSGVACRPGTPPARKSTPRNPSGARNPRMSGENGSTTPSRDSSNKPCITQTLAWPEFHRRVGMSSYFDHGCASGNFCRRPRRGAGGDAGALVTAERIAI